MKELEFIEIIKKTLSKSSFIGDDCAYLKELGIVITHDSLVEDVHFSRGFATPYQIGHKALMVNLSDVFASGAVPKYLTISLSLPKDIDNEFVKEFYRACDDICQEFGVEIVGGDITGSEKVFISVCAIGTTNGRKISSRKNAKIGDCVVVTGFHGSSAAGLWLLQNEIDTNPLFIKNHLKPEAQKHFSNEIATKVTEDYAMMDTSDGLMDALYKIAAASDVLISVDFDKIPYDKDIEKIVKKANLDFKDWIFYGGEDFQLVACVGKEELQRIEADYTIIGQVNAKSDVHPVEIIFGDKIEKVTNLERTFNHFKGDL